MGMVALKCPACGADIQLDDSREFGFCNYCGTKVMQEKIVVEHQGTVKVDNSEYVEKFLQNARRAYKKQDWEETEKYYNLVEQNDPSNIEAIFYSAYAKACNTLIDADYFKKQAAFGVLKRCVGIIDDNYDPSEKEIVQRVGKDIIGLYTINFVYTQKKNGYGMIVQDDKAKTIDLFNLVGAEFAQSCLNIAATYPKNDKDNRTYFYKIASSVADISCKYEFAAKVKKLAYPDTLKPITFINNSGPDKMKQYLTVVGVFDKQPISKGTSTIELASGDYKIIMYCAYGSLEASSAAKAKEATINIPNHSTVEITYKTFKGYNFIIS